MGKEVGKALKTFHEKNGVKFHMQVKVEKIVPSAEDPKRVGGIVVNGTTIPADVIVVSIPF